MAYESGYKQILAEKLNPADTSMVVSIAPTITSGRVYLKSWSQEEWITFTWKTWTTLTGLVRQLSKTADPAVSTGDWYTWIAGTTVKIVSMHDQMLDKALGWTISDDLTLQWDILVDKVDFAIDDQNSNWKIWRDWDSMKFSDNETAPVTLKTLASGNWADQYVSASATDLTVGHLDTKLTVDTWLKVSTVDPAWDESRKIEIDLTDTDVFVGTSSWAGDSGKVAKLNASGKLASGFIDEQYVLSNEDYLAWEDIVEWDSLYVSVWAADWWRTANRLYKTDATNVLRLPDIPRIAAWNYSTWDLVKYDFQWITKRLSWLTKDADYYISNTPGVISTTVGTNFFWVGTAKNTNELYITEYMNILNSWTTYTEVSNTTEASGSNVANYTKYRESVVGKNWMFTIRYDRWRNNWDTTYYKIQVNWVDFWAEDIISSSTLWYIWLRSVVGYLKKGDVVSLWAKNGSAWWGFSIKIKDFTITYTLPLWKNTQTWTNTL
jgi:hypothetical protein